MRALAWRVTPLLSGCAGMLLAAQAGAADLRFEPRVSLGQSWTDNVNLAPSEAEVSERITELKPGFTFGLDAPRARAELDYDLQALWFADNSDFDEVFHQARGTGTFILDPDSLFFDVFGRYAQQTIDPAGRVAFENFFNTENRTDSLVLGASPYHIGRWGNWGESLLRFNYQAVRYTNSDPASFRLQDSDRQSLIAALGSPEAQPGLSWRTTGMYSRTEFDTAPDFKYGRVGVDFGIPVGLRTRLTASGGVESDIADDPSAGGLDSTFWYLGFSWEPSDLQSVEAKVGERYYGTAWEVHWRRRGSKGEIRLDYEEEPITSAGVLGDDRLFEPGLRPDGLPRLDARVFLRKRLSTRANYEFVRSTLTARLYTERREFEDSLGGNERAYGTSLAYDWDFAVRTRLGANAHWNRRTFSDDDREDTFGEISARLSRDLTRTLSAVLRAGHFVRRSDRSFDYSANIVSLSVLAQF